MKTLTLIFLTLLIMRSTGDFNDHEQSLLYYIHRDPTIPSAHPPLLILLHGTGSNEQDLFSFADQLPGKFLVVSARAPYTIARGSYTWYELHFANGKPIYNKEQAEQSRKTILAFLEQLKTKHNFDPTQVYLCGFSQGGIMSYSVGLTHPDKIKGIAVMSGRLLEEVKTMKAPKEELEKLKIFISHGTEDHVLTIPYARESRAYLQQLGLSPEYKEYPAGHTISQDMFRDLLNWLNK